MSAARTGRDMTRGLRRPGAVVAVLILLVLTAWAVAPGAFTAHDPVTGIPAERLLPPGPGHWFGTDHLGRDLFARTVHGTGLTVRAALLAIAVALGGGAAIGLIAGFSGGVLDDVLMRGIDVVLAIPGLLLSLAVVTALGFGTVNVALAVGVASAPVFARVMRSRALHVRHAGYVEAARLAGSGPVAIVLRHVLPNAAGPVLVLAAVELGAVALAVSSLSFLGFGATPPTPEWGALIAEGRDYLAVAWWYTALPGLVLAAGVLAAGRLGRTFEAEGRHAR
ncbi:ABC transporter permease [Myceligenerans crystallogenes]|uniref:ABC transporter permease n=1 Tax=Myceligenerans crystallogenes TaxID=316335 RepID=A0ABN2NA42_9MICO